MIDIRELDKKEILELAENYFDYQGGWIAYSKEDLLEFARVMYNKGQEEEIRRQKTGIGYVNGVLFMDEF